MGNIVLLDELTINKIAAGEVIERPASVVKEMVENSLDAGATSINIEIQNGGITQIRISDNGKGIAVDDMRLAFERHATSKIRVADDLESVKTMGFRGEALASVAAISRVEMISRTNDSDMGNKIIVEGGKILVEEPVGAPVGTTIKVSNLFYNTPVRYKFLKKDYTEAGYIEDAVTRLALVNPNVAIKLINSGKTVLQTHGNGDLKSVIYSIYGKDIAEAILNVDYEYENIRVTGVIGKPEIARSNRLYQQFFVNGRYVKDKTLTAAAEQSFKGIIPTGRFGFIILNIEIASDKVDVNVHPAKLEVRFQEENKVFKAVMYAIKEALLQAQLIKNVSKEERKVAGDFRSHLSEILKMAKAEVKTEPSFAKSDENEFKVKEDNVNEANTPMDTNILSDMPKITANNTDSEVFKPIENTENEELMTKDNIENEVPEPKENAGADEFKPKDEQETKENKTSTIADIFKKISKDDEYTDKNVIEELYELKQKNYEGSLDYTKVIPKIDMKERFSFIKDKEKTQDIPVGSNVERIERKDGPIQKNESIYMNDSYNAPRHMIESEPEEESESTKKYDFIKNNDFLNKNEYEDTKEPEATKEIESVVKEQKEDYEKLDFEKMYEKTFGDIPASMKKKEETFHELKYVDNVSFFDGNEKYSDYKYIGSAFSTFIILEIGDELYIIDQHAAHERIMYEKVKKNFYSTSEKDSQLMLVPDIINLTHKEMLIARENMDVFAKAGFIVDEFGENTIKLSGVPNICIDLDTKSLFMDILDEIDTVARTERQEIEEKFIATVACKSAVKANNELTEPEVRALMDKLLTLPNPFTCPHGRPTAIKMTKADFEKKFARRQ